MRRYGFWILLAAWLLCLGAAALLPRAAGRPAGTRSAEIREARVQGEALPLRAYLPDEPVLWEAVGVWRTHPALDLPGETVTALRAGRVARVWEDRLWAVCAEVDCGGEVWVYRSLQRSFVGEGDSLAPGDELGVAGVSPAEAELGAHVHIERLVDGASADPLEDARKGESPSPQNR